MQQNLRVLRDHGQQILLRIPLRNLYLPLQNAQTHTQKHKLMLIIDRKVGKMQRKREKKKNLRGDRFVELKLKRNHTLILVGFHS